MHFGRPWASFWFPLGALWPPFGALWRLFGPLRITKWPLGATCSAKKAPKAPLGNRNQRFWSRPGRETAPKTFQNDPKIDLYIFLKDFGPIKDRLFMIFSLTVNMSLFKILCILEHLRINARNRLNPDRACQYIIQLFAAVLVGTLGLGSPGSVGPSGSAETAVRPLQ